MDTVTDIQNLFATNKNVYLIVSVDDAYKVPSGLTPTEILEFKHNELVYVMDTIQWILNNYNSE